MSKVRGGQVFVEIGADPSQLFKVLGNLNRQIGQVGQRMAMAGAGVTALGTAITAPLAAAATAFATVGDAVQKMASRTGMSTEAVSSLGYAAEQSGTDMATLEKGVRGMQRAMDAAATKGGEAAELFQRLGLDVRALSQLSPEDQFVAIADALSGVQDPGKRAALAMQVFGKAGAALLPLLEGGAAGIAELQAEAIRLGIVMDRDTANAATALGDAVDAMGKGLRSIVVNIGGAVAPIFTQVARVVSLVAGEFSRFVKENGRFVQIALAVGAGVAAIGAALTVAGFAAMGLSAGLTAVGGVIGALLSPIALLVAGLGAVVAFGPQIAAGMASAFGSVGSVIGNAANTIAGPLRAAVQDAAVVFDDLGQTASTTLQGISDALTAGNLSGAMDMLWAGLTAGWLRGVQALMSYVDPFVADLQNTFTYLATNVMNIWETMNSNIAQALVTVGAVIMGVVDNIVNGVMAAFDAMVAAVQKSWNWVQSFIVEGYDLAEENRKVDSQMAARAQERAVSRPGVEGRNAAASEVRRGIREDAARNIEANNAAAGATMAGRLDATSQRADARTAATQAAEARVAELAAQFATEAAAVAADQSRKAGTPLDVSGAAATQADIVGTFSGAALGQLGFGSNLAQKQLDETKRTNEILEEKLGVGVQD